MDPAPIHLAAGYPIRECPFQKDLGGESVDRPLKFRQFPGTENIPKVFHGSLH
jgi:hypothetical protein